MVGPIVADKLTGADREAQIKQIRALSTEEFLAVEIAEKDPVIDGLVHKRDLVAFAARRRHGKTGVVTNMAVEGAVGAPDFLGYPIPKPFRSLLVLVEDDPRELQDRLKRLIGDRDAGRRLHVITRDDFHAHEVPINATDPHFKLLIWTLAQAHRPDLIVLDNLAHLIGAEYNDPVRVHKLMKFGYQLARAFNCALIFVAHPRKQGQGDDRVTLEGDPELFFESIMGTSHFINSTGSLWGLERDRERDYSRFLTGRQRSDGHQQLFYIRQGDDGRFEVLDEAATNLPLVLNTDQRQRAWELLPEPPTSFGYREGRELVQPALRSSDTYAKWIKECRRLHVVLDTEDGKLKKADGLPRVLGGAN
jgi:hypothetical protein